MNTKYVKPLLTLIFPGSLDDLFAYNPVDEMWINLNDAHGVRPCPRWSHGFLAAGKVLYLFGGQQSTVAGDLGDLHSYDIAAHKWTDLSNISNGVSPSPRWGHGFATAGGRLYLHGGWAQGQRLVGGVCEFFVVCTRLSKSSLSNLRLSPFYYCLITFTQTSSCDR